MGQYVLTYVYQGHLQAEMVAVLVDTHGALGLGWTRARQAGHYPTLQRVVESALHPNSLLYCQLVLPEYLGLDKVCGRRGWGGGEREGREEEKKGREETEHPLASRVVETQRTASQRSAPPFPHLDPSGPAA